MGTGSDLLRLLFLRFIKQIEDGRPAQVLVAMATADGRALHVQEVFATPAADFDLLRQTKQALGHFSI